MTPEQKQHLREMADPSNDKWSPGVNALAQVVLELAAKQRELEIDHALTATSATRSATSATVLEDFRPGGTDIALSNDAVLDVRAVEGPITAEELERRGIEPELEARAIDVILRCGWPDRKKHCVNVEPCVPVPVKMLEGMRDSAQDIHLSQGSPVPRRVLLACLNDLLAEQDRIQSLYVEALPDPEPLPERHD